MPTDIGLHNLTIITYDTDYIEHVFSFFFLVDQENPIIGDLSAISNNWFETTDSFAFTITDNNASLSNLEVYISFDDTDNITLIAPNFQINLADLSLRKDSLR